MLVTKNRNLFLILLVLPLLTFCDKKPSKDEKWEDGSPKIKVEEILSPLDGRISIVKYYTKRGDTNNYRIDKYYDNEHLAEKGQYVNGLKEGVWGYWYKNGNKSIKENYKQGERVGFYKSWYPDGKELEKIEF